MTQLTVGRLGPADLAELSRLLDTDPVMNVYLRSELRLGPGTGLWWGLCDEGAIRAAALGGPLLVPCMPDPADAAAMAEGISRQQPPARMVVGPREAVLAIHGATGIRAREVRDPQLVMLVDGARLQRHAAPVRRSERSDVDLLSIAAAAMHREEMGVDPLAIDANGWRARMTMLVDRGWSWIWREGGEVIFKAELSAWTPEVAQVQGVYTAPRHRGRGIATAALSAICADILARVPLCTLYVNAYNASGVRLYQRLGFWEAGRFATVFY